MDQNISVDSLENAPCREGGDVGDVISAESVIASALAELAATEQPSTTTAAATIAVDQLPATPDTLGDLSFGPVLSGLRVDSEEIVKDEEPQPLIDTNEEEPQTLIDTTVDKPLVDTEDEKQQQHLPGVTEDEDQQQHLVDMREEAGASFLVDPLKSQLTEEQEEDMEFSKNYSDDLMGQNDGHQQPTSADLADFEMPVHSGSSTGSEATRQSQQQEEQPKLERKTSSRSTSTSSSLAQPTASSQSPLFRPATTTTTSSAPNLSAVKDLITSSYSRVSHVFQWERPLETGIIFGVGLTIIMTLTFFSIISVFAYSALGVILASALIRLHKAVCKTLNRSSQTPFDPIWDKVLGLNVTLSPERMHQLIDSSLSNLNASLVYFKQVLLFEDKYATFKFGVFLYLLTHIGAWFNGMTLITLGYLAIFSVPILYQKNKTNIDQYVKLANNHISSTLSMVTNRASSLVSNQSPSSSHHQD